MQQLLIIASYWDQDLGLKPNTTSPNDDHIQDILFHNFPRIPLLSSRPQRILHRRLMYFIHAGTPWPMQLGNHQDTGLSLHPFLIVSLILTKRRTSLQKISLPRRKLGREWLLCMSLYVMPLVGSETDC